MSIQFSRFLCAIAIAWTTNLAVASPRGDIETIDAALSAHVRSGPDARETAMAVFERAAAGIPDAVHNDAVRARWGISRALDQLAKLPSKRDGGATPERAFILVELMTLLGNYEKLEIQKGDGRSIGALKAEVWRAEVAPLAVRARDGAPVALAPEKDGRLLAQWVTVERKSVRVFDLWGNEDRRQLQWSNATFADPMPDSDGLQRRGVVESEAIGTKLTLYVDLAGLSGRDRDRLLRASRRSDPSSLHLVLDDTQGRADTCVSEHVERKAEATAEKAEPQKPHESALTPIEDVAPRRDASAERKPQIYAAKAADIARACATSARKGSLPKQIVLFDPIRRLKIRSFEAPTEDRGVDRILDFSNRAARAWP